MGQNLGQLKAPKINNSKKCYKAKETSQVLQILAGFWLRGEDLNLRPPGYEGVAFLQDQGITTPEQLDAFQARTLDNLTKRRTLLNVRKKRRRELYSALADEAALEPAKECFDMGLPGMEEELARYQAAKALLDQCPISRERLMEEKGALYQQLAEVDREIRATRKQLALCKAILYNSPQMERDIQAAEGRLEKPEQKREHHKEDLGSR